MDHPYNQISKVEVVWNGNDISDITFCFADNPDEVHSIHSFGWETKTRKYLERILEDIYDAPVHEEGDECPKCHDGCLELHRTDVCSCHISPPCSACVDSKLKYDKCDFIVE